MPLSINPVDLIIDETASFTDDDNVDPALALYSTDPTLVYLLGLDDSGGLASPRVAYQADFVSVSLDTGESIGTVTLTQDSIGTPFSTTDGVNSGKQTVDGNYIWLFQDATHANIVIGVIGTSDPNFEPAEDGPLAFSLALVNNTTTTPDLYTVLYVPLLHPVDTNPDDRIDLTDKVFASASGSTTSTFSGQNAAPGNHDFYVINSGNDASKQILVTGFLGTSNATANVSTQGFGVNNQSINPTEMLQVDFVTGGNLAAGTSSQIQYGSHIETISQAGFTINQITPSNPNLRVDIRISASNVQGNEYGLNFWDGSPTTGAPITSITLTGQSGFGTPITTNGNYNVAGNIDVVVSGMGTSVVTITGLDNVTTVDITTSSPLDRLTVTGVDSNEGLDITEFHFKSETPNARTDQVGSFINFDDDGPSGDGTTQTLIADEDGATVGTGNTGGPGDDSAAAKADTESVTGIFNPGSDGAGAYSFSSDASGLTTALRSQGGTVVYDLTGNTLTGYVDEGDGVYGAGDRNVFTLVLDGATGSSTFTLLDQLDSYVTADPDPTGSQVAFEEQVTIDFSSILQMVDKDGDAASAAANKLIVTVDDDSPVILSADSLLTYAATDNPTPGGTGTFSYSIGFDDRVGTTYSASNTDILLTLTGGTVGGGNIAGAEAHWVSETNGQVVYGFSYNYALTAGGTADQPASGTITFDKDADTYNISLTAAPTGSALVSLKDPGAGFTGYLANTATVTNSQPPVSVAALAANTLFVQFNGSQETSGGTDGNNTLGANHNLDAFLIGQTWTSTDSAHTHNDDQFTNGELFSQTSSWVSVSGSAAGVAGDTMQAGEVLDFDLWSGNPRGYENGNGASQATSPLIFMQFDGLDNGEDLVVILKLVNENNSADVTTRAVIVQYGDIYHKDDPHAADLVGFGFKGTLDNNDGLVVIERNDYNGPGEHYLIQGAQVLASTEGVTGSGIDLNKALGDGGGSLNTAGTALALSALTAVKDSGKSNGGTWDGDVFKITNIGFATSESHTPDTQLAFGVQVVDYDGDKSDSQTITVDITGDAAASTLSTSIHESSLVYTNDLYDFVQPIQLIA